MVIIIARSREVFAEKFIQWMRIHWMGTPNWPHSLMSQVSSINSRVWDSQIGRKKQWQTVRIVFSSRESRLEILVTKERLLLNSRSGSLLLKVFRITAHQKESQAALRSADLFQLETFERTKTYANVYMAKTFLFKIGFLNVQNGIWITTKALKSQERF